MNPIIPTIFAHNKKEFDERFAKLLPVSKNLQIDYMDGKFIKEKSMPLSAIPNLKKYKINFEAHLMCDYPQKRIPKLKRLGFKKIIFHYSAPINISQVIARARNHKLSPWLAINPNIPVKKILPYLKQVDGIFFMGVFPGKEKQSFVQRVYTKIKQLRSLNKKIKIQVDGGANEKTIPKLAKLGVNYINSGSYIENSDNPKNAFKELNALFRKHSK
jgi:ribulose-phosphate 3-epimerase